MQNATKSITTWDNYTRLQIGQTDDWDSDANDSDSEEKYIAISVKNMEKLKAGIAKAASLNGLGIRETVHDLGVLEGTVDSLMHSLRNRRP
jgi:hypothetical protein